MSFALGVLGLVGGVGRAMKDISIAELEGRQALEKLKAEETAKIEEENRQARREEDAKKQERIDNLVNAHQDLSSDPFTLISFNAPDQVNFFEQITGKSALEKGPRAGVFQLEAFSGQNSESVSRTGTNYVITQKENNSALKEQRFQNILTGKVVVNGVPRYAQWEAPYLAHKAMTESFGANPTPDQVQQLEYAEQQYRDYFSAISTLLEDLVIQKKNDQVAATQFGETSPPTTPSEYNVLYENPVVREILLNSRVPADVIDKFIILPALDRSMESVGSRRGYLLQFYTDQSTAVNPDSIVQLDPSVSPEDVTRIRENEMADGQPPMEAHNSTVKTVEAAQNAARGTPNNANENLTAFMKFRKDMPNFVNVVASEEQGTLTVGFDNIMMVENPADIMRFKRQMRQLSGLGQTNPEISMTKFLAMQDVVAIEVEKAANLQTNPYTGLRRGQSPEARYRATENLAIAAAEHADKIYAVTEENVRMASQLFNGLEQYIRAVDAGKPIPFATGFAGKVIMFVSGARAQARQLGFNVDSDGNYVEYADRNGKMGTDEELANYFSKLATQAGMTVSSDGTVVMPSEMSIEQKTAYRKFLETQFVYMMARSLENPEGGGARLSVNDIDQMREAFGTGKFFDNPANQYPILGAMLQKFLIARNRAASFVAGRNDVYKYTAAKFLQQQVSFTGFNLREQDPKEAVQAFLTDALQGEPPDASGQIYVPYSQQEQGSDSDGQGGVDYLNPPSGTSGS